MTACLNRDMMRYEGFDLDHLDETFNEDGIKDVIFSLPSIKAPRTDDFIGAFLKACWETTNVDVIEGLHVHVQA